MQKMYYQTYSVVLEKDLLHSIPCLTALCNNNCSAILIHIQVA